MRSPRRITRMQLSINEENELVMFGIVSTDPDYKLSLSLNKKLHISLKRISVIEFRDDTDSEQIFSRFSDSSGAPDLIFDLVSNRSGKNFLLKKLKNIDFIFQVYDPGGTYDINQLVTLLREIETVTAVFNMDIKALKDKNLKFLSH